MSLTTEIETVLSARHVDIDNREQLAARCEEHAIPEDRLRAVIDTFRPLTDSLEVFLTRWQRVAR